MKTKYFSKELYIKDMTKIIEEEETFEEKIKWTNILLRGINSWATRFDKKPVVLMQMEGYQYHEKWLYEMEEENEKL